MPRTCKAPLRWKWMISYVSLSCVPTLVTRLNVGWCDQVQDISARVHDQASEDAFPLLSRKPTAATARRRRKNICEFWHRLLVQCQHSMLFSHEWPTFVADVLVAACGASQPKLRHSAVVLALEFGAALAEVTTTKAKELAVCKRQLSTATKARVRLVCVRRRGAPMG